MMFTLRIPEQLLRHVWLLQRFNTTHLQTTDGRSIEIISPGTPNSNGGPDFVDARIRIGETMYRGDVELHTDASGWTSHHHQLDPHYNRIILHVALTADDPSHRNVTSSGRPVPLLILGPIVDNADLSSQAGSVTQPLTEGVLRCHGRNLDTPAETIASFLEKLSLERMERKVRRFEERLKQLIEEERQSVQEPRPWYLEDPGEIPVPQQTYSRKDFANRQHWEQVMYEGVMDALGYSKNRVPFVALAQAVRLATLQHHNIADAHTNMAILFGAAGLLPPTRSLAEPEARAYVRMLRMRWNEIRPSLKIPLLNPGEWLFFRLRPGNFPTARLAAFCFILPTLFHEGAFKSLIDSFKTPSLNVGSLNRTMRSLFAFTPDGFWSRHYHFRSASSSASIRLGWSRRHDIVINVFLPLAMLYARVFNDLELRLGTRRVLGILSPAQKNSITRAISRELLLGKLTLNSALLHQGAIQLFKYYCTAGKCGECAVGKEVFGAGSMSSDLDGEPG